MKRPQNPKYQINGWKPFQIMMAFPTKKYLHGWKKLTVIESAMKTSKNAAELHQIDEKWIRECCKQKKKL